MMIPSTWLYPPSLKEAAEIQKLLAEKIVLEDRLSQLRLIGGMDNSNNLYDPRKMIYAGYVVLDAETRILQAQTSYALHQPFPYISGFLGFREAPALVKAFEQFSVRPDIIFVDGHGISHPRGLGIASHIGVLLNTPTIGIAKNILVGEPQGVLGSEVGDRVLLLWKNKAIGVLLRTKKRSKPLIISPGHGVTQETALNIVLNNLSGYRLPEATRFAHLAANACRKEDMRARGI